MIERTRGENTPSNPPRTNKWIVPDAGPWCRTGRQLIGGLSMSFRGGPIRVGDER
jgi:hypothetical protein